MIQPNNLTVKRLALYESVWTETMENVAKRYGLSERTILDMCHRFDIPLPEWRYWDALRGGKAEAREPLPKPEHNPDLKVQFKTLVIEDEAHWMAAQELSQKENLPEFAIVVSHLSTHPDPIVLATRSSLRSAKADLNGLLRTEGQTVLDIRVSRSSIDRSIHIASALVHALSKRHLNLVPRKHGVGIQVLDEVVDIVIEEFSGSGPAGRRLRIALDSQDHSIEYVRRIWADGKKQHLEDCLNSVMAGIFYAAVAIRNSRLYLQRFNRNFEERREQERERIRIDQEAKQKQEHLDKVLGHWRKCNEIRSLLAAVHERYEKAGRLIEVDSELGKWLMWAEGQADSLDPIKLPQVATLK